MFITIRKGKIFALVNTANIAFIEPHKDNANATVIHFDNALYVVATQPYEQIAQKLAMSGVMQ